MLSAIVGINWGDEGKGRMVDLLSQDYDVVVRYQGAVAQYDVAAAVLGYFRIVRYENDGASFGMQLLEEHQNFE